MATIENGFNAPLRTMADGNQDVFRYGLFKYDQSNYEDPTYLGFTVEIDENSAFFNEVLPFLEKQGKTRAELQARVSVYKEFCSKIVQIFKSQESVEDPSQRAIYIKQHYINAISGLGNLTHKFNKWREDKLTIELYEDITMFSSYISSLYNNLIYSYENGRAMIPENLLKFNLKIKISEIRNLTSIGKAVSKNPSDQEIFNALKNNVTCLVYTLYDCEFDFFETQPFEDTITQAGIDSSYPGVSILKFDIFFKSVAREIFNPLIKNSLTLNDNEIDLGVILVSSSGDASTNGQMTDDSGTAIGNNGEPFQKQTTSSVTAPTILGFPNTIRKPSAISTYNSEVNADPDIRDTSDFYDVYQQKSDILEYNSYLAPDPRQLQTTQFDALAPNSSNGLLNSLVGKNLANVISDPTKALNNLATQIVKKVENSLVADLQKAEQLLKQKRNELVRTFVNDLENKVGIKKIIPANVYTDPYYYAGQNYFQNALGQFKSDVGGTIGSDIISSLTGG